MSTLYFHIPFCKQACHYCDFHFSTLRKTYTPVIEAMLRELELQQKYLADKKLTSIYFGGGTPSLLELDDLNRFLETAHQYFTLADGAEITLEANPDDITRKGLKAYLQMGINRLSIGTQSFFDTDLRLMNRAHTAAMAESAVKRAQDAGFTNITIDLIYGMPGSTAARWQQNVQQAIDLQVPHLSAYALTVEPQTALAKQVAKGTLTLPDDETVAAQYHALCNAMAKAGFQHYELSNFGQPRYYSKHNTSYWAGTPYLGIGPSAHSYNGSSRQWNVANNTLYIKQIVQNTDWFEHETLNESDHYNEYIMTGLRTANGIDLRQIASRFGAYRTEKLLGNAQNYLECGRLKLQGDQLTIPESEWLLSDKIIADLFWV